MQIIPKDKCSGCSACYSACPSKAISMQKDIEGFLYPVIDEEKCTNCNLCRKTCPILNKYIKKDQNLNPACYAGWNKDEYVRKNSSSGGLFSVVAKHILNKKGYICGASFEGDNRLRHIIISNENDLPKLRGSKYLQSEVGDVFLDVKKLLEGKNWVLFVGTPCQVSGLSSFLKKDYEKLLTIDIMCHGTPSPSVFEKYIKDIEKSTGKKIVKIKFRDKSTGWKSYSFSVSDEHNNIIYKEINHRDIFSKGFLSNLYLKPLCTSCPFATLPRQSDITLGDFWAIWEHKKELDDDKGISLILINNTKGKSFFDKIKNEIVFEEVPINIAHTGNLALSMPCDRHINRGEFFKEFSKNNRGVEKLILSCLDDNHCDLKNSVGIFNMRLPSSNFGATLQAFALQRSIEKFGYNTKVINYVSDMPEKKEDKLCKLGFYKFREEYIKMTPECKTDGDLIKLNDQFDTFIVGSDQVWNYTYLSNVFKENIGKYFLNFVLPSKNIFSYAPSFAENHWKGNTEEIEQVKKALKNFSAISVREKDGVDICKNIFNVNAVCVLDPTFLLDQKDYQDIIDNELVEKSNEKYASYFILDANLEKSISINDVSNNIIKKINYKLLNIRGHEKEIFGEKRFVFNTVPVWLNHIKQSEFIITDSYHCAIFAIIFERQFVVIARDYAGNSRLESLLSILNIKNRFLRNMTDISIDTVFENPIDYNIVYEKLNTEKEKSLKFLADSLRLSALDKNKKEIINPLVSIIIPVYNGANYMREAIDSALAQTYKNIEVIVINDGSTDNTEEIAKSYGDKIRYFSKENGGVATALNLAIKNANGKYISWLSHDDVYYPEKIEKQIDFLAKHDSKNIILYSDYKIIDEKSKVTGTVIKDHEMLDCKPEYSILRGSINGITLLIPKKAFDNHGFFDEKLKCTQDYAMWFEMIKTYKFIHMPMIFAKYRVHQAQDTNRNPNVAIEGDELWIKMIRELSFEAKERLEGSELEFFKQMVFFLRQTPYKKATMFANKKANEILVANNKPEINFTKEFIFPSKNELVNKIRFIIFSPKKFLKKYLS